MCPNCRSANTHRSRRRGLFERVVLRMAFVRAYRCDNCSRRFYSSPFQRRSANGKS